MKTSLLYFLSAILFLASCKKGEDGPGVMKQPPSKAEYSYGKFNEKDAMAMADVNGKDVVLTVEKSDFTEDKGAIRIHIDNYNGPGTYTFSDHVTVTAGQDNYDTYWQHYYYEDKGRVYATGNIKIVVLTDDQLTFELNGKLYHVDEQSGQRTQTALKASVDTLW